MTTLVGLDLAGRPVRSPAIVVMGAVAAEGFIDDPACATEAGDA